MSNIAEGFESQSNKMFISYLYRVKAQPTNLPTLDFLTF